MMIARSAEASALMRERLFDPDVARARRGRPPVGARQLVESWVWDKLSFYL